MSDSINEADLPLSLVKSVNDAAAYFGWTEEQRQQEMRRQHGYWLIEEATLEAWTDEINEAFAALDRRRELDEAHEQLHAILAAKVDLAEKHGLWPQLIHEERERGTLPEVIEIIRTKHETLGRVLEILEDEDPTP